jgi:hypothetical protein
VEGLVGGEREAEELLVDAVVGTHDAEDLGVEGVAGASVNSLERLPVKEV